LLLQEIPKIIIKKTINNQPIKPFLHDVERCFTLKNGIKNGKWTEYGKKWKIWAYLTEIWKK
jgi:hypothetical protein